jgi:hypothetical protein
MFSCNEYHNNDNSFYSINLLDWNSSICPKKIVFEKYAKHSNFQDLIESDSNFDINCYIKYNNLNKEIITADSKEKRELIPNFKNINQINYDIRLVVDDSLEYMITSIENRSDTIIKSFTSSRKFYVGNVISTMIVNGNKINNNSRSINIPTKIAKFIKK